jgi:DNA-binding transcriptional regulator YiaG
MTKKSPAEMLKAIRKATNLTKEQFSAHFGITVASVNPCENGRATPQPLALKNVDEWAKRHGLE